MQSKFRRDPMQGFSSKPPSYLDGCPCEVIVKGGAKAQAVNFSGLWVDNETNEVLRPISYRANSMTREFLERKQHECV